jgi:hypothetical protein
MEGRGGDWGMGHPGTRELGKALSCVHSLQMRPPELIRGPEVAQTGPR